jgi:hypothetical protein
MGIALAATAVVAAARVRNLRRDATVSSAGLPGFFDMLPPKVRLIWR